MNRAGGSATSREHARQGKQARSAVPKVKCPNCFGDAHVIRSRQMTDLIREITYQCLEDECGIRFVAQLVAVRIIRAASFSIGGALGTCAMARASTCS